MNYLVDRAGRLVSQNDLLEALWTEKFVQPEVLKTHILEIRNALGDDAKNPKFIETQPRRGYRFVAEIRDDAADQARKSATRNVRSWLPWAAAALLLLVAATGFILRRPREHPATPQQVRFKIPLPEHVTLTFPRLAVSPNGKHLVFWGETSDGVNRLWLRDLDSTESRMLPGSETNDSRILPAWSPDSRYLAFNAYGKIKKIHIAEGHAQVVCDVPGGVASGIAWASDDLIVFGTGESGPGILRVSASGGTAVAITKLDPLRGEILHGLPVPLPDGKRFLYARASRIAANYGWYVGSLNATPQQQSLQRIADLPLSAIVYVPAGNGSGHVLYRDSGMIMAKPFDPVRLKVTSGAVSITEMAHIETAQPGFSVSRNGVLAYQSSMHQVVQPTWIDRSGKSLGTFGEAGAYVSISLAPDEKRLVVADHNDLWLIEPLQGKTTRLTFHVPGEDVSRATWSPDGGRIAFGTTGLDHRDYFDLYEKTLTGSGDAHLLLKTTEHKEPTAWSPNGRFLLFTHRNTAVPLDVWALPGMDGAVPGQEPFVVLRTPFNESDGSFSPDSKWFAYISDESGRNDVYIRPFVPRATGESAPGGGRLVSNYGGVEVRWPRDSKELFYLTPDGKIMAVPVTTGSNIHIDPPHVAFAGKAEPNLWDVSVDGKRLLIAVPVRSFQAPFTVLLNWQAALTKN